VNDPASAYTAEEREILARAARENPEIARLAREVMESAAKVLSMTDEELFPEEQGD
jgi:hypothetical protein